ncbi:MAG: SDR family oxidoreductase [Deltaproteobacteria bacterium]
MSAPRSGVPRTVVVTGASAGIGAEIARRLAAGGDRVHLAARRADKLGALAATIRADGGEAVAHACDIGDAASTKALFDTVAASDGRIDALVNSAAVLWLEDFASLAEADWEAMLATNLGGAIRVTQQALAHMLPRDAGHILHLTSTAADLALPGLAVYSATKAGVRQLLAALRGEYGKTGVRFTDLQIGNTAGTEGGGQALRPMNGDAARHILRWTGAPEMMRTQDVADTVAWALSTPPSVRLDRIVLRERAEIPT